MKLHDIRERPHAFYNIRCLLVAASAGDSLEVVDVVSIQIELQGWRLKLTTHESPVRSMEPLGLLTPKD